MFHVGGLGRGQHVDICLAVIGRELVRLQMIVHHRERVAFHQQGVFHAAVERTVVIHALGPDDGETRIAGQGVRPLPHAMHVVIGIVLQHPLDVRLLEASAGDVFLQADDVGPAVAQISQDAVGIAGRVGMVGLKRHDVVRQHLDGAVGRLVATGVERTEGVRRSPAARNPGQRHQGVTPMRQQPEGQKQHVGTQEHGKGQPRARLHRMAHRVDMGAVGTEHHAAHHRQIGGQQKPSHQLSQAVHPDYNRLLSSKRACFSSAVRLP